MELELPEIDQELIKKIKDKNIDKVYEDETLRNFIEANKISREKVYKYLSSFLRVLDSFKLCSSCNGLLKCPKNGLKYDLVINNDMVNEQLIPCDKLVKIKTIKSNFVRFEGNEDAFNYSLQDTLITFRDERKALVASIASMIKSKDLSKGIYLVGDEGVGKTFIMSIFAKLITEYFKDYSIAYINSKDWIINLSNKTYQLSYDYDEDLRIMEKVKVLFIDNFGDEKDNGFIDSDVLASILMKRKENGLTTFFISKYDLFDIRNIYSYTKNGKENSKKIIDYIKENCIIRELKTMKYPF